MLRPAARRTKPNISAHSFVSRRGGRGPYRGVSQARCRQPDPVMNSSSGASQRKDRRHLSALSGDSRCRAGADAARQPRRNSRLGRQTPNASGRAPSSSSTHRGGLLGLVSSLAQRNTAARFSVHATSASFAGHPRWARFAATPRWTRFAASAVARFCRYAAEAIACDLIGDWPARPPSTRRRAVRHADDPPRAGWQPGDPRQRRSLAWRYVPRRRGARTAAGQRIGSSSPSFLALRPALSGAGPQSRVGCGEDQPGQRHVLRRGCR